MDREQSLDPVDVLDTFVNQPAMLTMEPTVVRASATLGTRTTLQTFGSPRRYAISDRAIVRHQRGPSSLGALDDQPETCRIDDIVADAVGVDKPSTASATWLRLASKWHSRTSSQRSSHWRWI
jgi:hypothetical protein